MLSYAGVHSMWTFLVVACLVEAGMQASSTVRNTLIAVALPPEQRALTRSYLRVATNLGIGAGSAVGAIALQLDTRTAYLSLIDLDALTFLISAALLAWLPMVATAGQVGERRGRLRALTDGPYLAITALNAVMILQFGIFKVGLPLWIAGHTHAPRILVAVVLVLNTALTCSS